MNRRILLAATISLALLPISSAIAENAPGVTATEIKIGATYPFSGPASAYGVVGHGLMAYVKALNDKGGINGRQINFIALDDAYSPPKAVEQMRRLVENDEVAFVFAPLGTATNAATIKYLNRMKIPDLFIVSGGSKFTNFTEYPYTTTGVPSYETEGKIYAKYIAEKLPNAKVALLYQNDDLGKDFLNALKGEFKNRFADKVIALPYEFTDPTIDSQVVKLRNSGADIFLFGGTPKFAAQAIRKIHETGWKPLLIVNVVASAISSTLKPAGLDISTGVVSAAYLKDIADPKMKDDPGVKSYRELLGKYGSGADISDFNYIAGVVQGMLLEQVLKQCGDDLSRDNILKQSRSIKNLALPMVLPGILINTNGKNSQAFTQLKLQRFNGTGWEVFGEAIGAGAE
ncbi:MAG: ABC transporter substrate-binding protein [Rhizobiales bacterium]|nr:ABC transporter substrate-binding protein [Hyphomicrobiales bacterium]